jgi:uncharacterized protein DUF6176
VLRVSIRRVREGQLDRLRWWLGELNRRQEEVRETFEQESVRHEQAYIVDTADGHLLVYAMEVEDEEQARAAFRASTLPIDAEHARVMGEVLGEAADAELLYDVKAGE